MFRKDPCCVAKVRRDRVRGCGAYLTPTFAPDARAHAVYNDLYALYRELHDGFGGVAGGKTNFGTLMKRLLAGE